MDDIIIVLLVIGVMIAVFLLLREFWCWYWKISHRLQKLDNIEKSLEELNHLMRRQLDGTPSDGGKWTRSAEESQHMTDQSPDPVQRKNSYHDGI